MKVIAHLFENTIEGFTQACDCLEFQKRADIAHGFVDLSDIDFTTHDSQYLTIAGISAAAKRAERETTT